MKTLIAAIALMALSACASQAPYRHAEGGGGYVTVAPAYSDWPLVYRARMFPRWYGVSPYYAYWGYPSPWGFYYYSPNFYPYHFSVAYSLWPDYYGGWYDPWALWRPPYRGHWHPHSGKPQAPVAGVSPGMPGAVGGRAAFRDGEVLRGGMDGPVIYRPQEAKSRAAPGLDALSGGRAGYYGRGEAMPSAGNPGIRYPSPSKADRIYSPPTSMPARTAAPRIHSGSSPRARAPASGTTRPAKPDWRRD